MTVKTNFSKNDMVEILLNYNILIDCVWHFERGDTEDFYERKN